MRVLVAAIVALIAATAHAQPAPAPATPAPAAPAPAPAAPSDANPSDVEPAEPSEPAHEPLHEDKEFGPVILIEQIDITGNTATQTEIIRRALPIQPGDILHASDRRLREVRFKVLALGYFRDVTLAMHKGSQRGHVVIEIHVVERGTFVLNRLWFGTNPLTPYWAGADVGERNLLGLGIAIGGGVIYASHGNVPSSRDQWAGELRLSDGALRGTRWGVNGALTLVHGSEAYRVAGTEGTTPAEFNAFPYRRFGGRWGVTYDITTLARLSAGYRLEEVDTALPVAPTQTLPGGEVVGVDLHLRPGESRIATAQLGFDRDTRPDPILPHSGGRITATAEIGSGVLGGSYDFLTVFARYEHWWPLRDERHTIGMRIAGGVVIGDADRFDRIHISDVDQLLTPRAMGLVLSNAAPLDILGTRSDKPSYGDLGGTATLEYAGRLFRGFGTKRVYGGDWFVGAGLWGLAEAQDLRQRDRALWSAMPIDVIADAGVRIDTELGVFELTLGNALGRLR
ncbi:MAG: BamA/TamA family outer membrane protein [Deltaproteobacteria bacterium]|nr:BamA/TamA family outer membrane protein [Deltaproteobacteria bacterium]